MRAVRMQFQFGCTIELETRTRLHSAVPLLKHVSAERVRDEWFKILQLADAAAALGEMAQFGLLHEVAPTFATAQERHQALETVRATERLWTALSAPTSQRRTAERLDVGPLCGLAPHLQRRYTATICDERSFLALLKCAALLHATDASGAALAARWKLSKREAELLHQAIHRHRDVQALVERVELSPRTIYRFFAQTGEAGIDAAMLSLARSLADGAPSRGNKAWSHQTENVARLLDAWFEHHNTQIAPTPLLSGKEIMRVLEQQSGPQIGELLRRLTEEQAAGEIVDRQQAIAYVQKWKTESQAES
jgi:tRNA nucleotidyltransferase/poly(A) polymerase